ncbi:hypothetical protein N7449_002064 [Penicillium cf. viridicatum]|uniref:Carrier domain-containing protein n=1 Tax=Penicillium cf. viridicatum TaxID=2972119 RepID=A0A9W9MUC5_9EURO|nr:hypothetical protein N7449_002064 [Penicillium cf. viridicatum]
MRKALQSSVLIAVNVLFYEGDKLNVAIECINNSEGTNSVTTTTAANSTVSNTKRWPLTEREIRLQQIFSQVLALLENAIDANNTLFTIGGGSISAMQLLNPTRRMVPTSTTTDFLLHNIIPLFGENFQPHLEDISTESSDVIDDMVPFRLSPIQSMLFSSVALTKKTIQPTLFGASREDSGLRSGIEWCMKLPSTMRCCGHGSLSERTVNYE